MATDWRGTPYARAAYAGVEAAGLWTRADWSYVAGLNAILDGLQAADLLAAGRGQRLELFDVEACVYVSTACQHGLHGRCRLSCKFCGASCGCPDCGHEVVAEDPDGAVAERQADLLARMRRQAEQKRGVNDVNDDG